MWWHLLVVVQHQGGGDRQMPESPLASESNLLSKSQACEKNLYQYLIYTYFYTYTKSKEKVKGSFLVDFKVLIKSSVCFL